MFAMSSIEILKNCSELLESAVCTVILYIEIWVVIAGTAVEKSFQVENRNRNKIE